MAAAVVELKRWREEGVGKVEARGKLVEGRRLAGISGMHPEPSYGRFSHHALPESASRSRSDLFL